MRICVAVFTSNTPITHGSCNLSGSVDQSYTSQLFGTLILNGPELTSTKSETCAVV